MSNFYPYDLACPTCGHRFLVELAAGIPITRMPQVREQILDGTFHVFPCPSCGKPTAVEASMVYTDVQRGQYVGVESAAGLSWQAALMRHQTVFEDCFVNAPSVARDIGRTVKKRIVFGFRALREKLLLWDAGLDDYVVEAVKGDLARELDMQPSEAVFRLSRVLPGGHLMFARFGPTPRPVEIEGQPAQLVLPAATDYETAPAEHYQRRLQHRGRISGDFPWLQDEWLVDLHDGPAYLYR